MQSLCRGFGRSSAFRTACGGSCWPIPTHQFLFNAGTIDKRFYMDLLQLEPEEYELIRQPQRGFCLYKCGNERYHLQVIAPPYKAALFGTAGGS